MDFAGKMKIWSRTGERPAHSRVRSFTCLALGRGRKMLEHRLNRVLELLLILIRVIGKRFARCSAPDEPLVVGVENVDDQGAYWRIFHRGGSQIRASETAPEPAPSK